jgi:hypothetical protein
VVQLSSLCRAKSHGFSAAARPAGCEALSWIHVDFSLARFAGYEGWHSVSHVVIHRTEARHNKLTEAQQPLTLQFSIGLFYFHGLDSFESQRHWRGCGLVRIVRHRTHVTKI